MTAILAPRAVEKPAVRSLAGLRELALATGGYLLLSLLLLYPLPQLMATHIDNYGDPLLNVTILAWYAYILPGDPARMFDFPFFAPYSGSLLFTEHLLAQGLLAWPIIRLTGNSILAYNVLVLSTFILGALGTYLLVRRLTGSRSAAFISGILFAFSPLRLAQSGHLQVLSLQWLPLGAYFLDRWIVERRWRDLALGALCVLLLSLSSYNLLPFAGLFLGIWCLFRTLAQPRRTWLGVAAGFAVVGVLVAGVNAPIVARYQQVSAEMGFVRSGDDVRTYSAIPQDYLASSKRSQLYGDLTSGIRRETGEAVLFFGAVAIVAAIVGVVVGWRRLPVIALVVASIVLVNISFGLVQPTKLFSIPLIWPVLYDATSIARGIRVTARAAAIVSFAVAVLAGIGLAALLPRLDRLSIVGAVGGSLGLARRTVVVAAIVALASFELLHRAPFGYDPAGEPDPAYAFLATAPRPGPAIVVPTYQHTGRVFLETQRMYANSETWRPLINGYSGFTPPALFDLSARMAAFPDTETMNLLRERGVSYVVVERYRYNETALRQLDAVLPSYPLREVANYGDVRIYEIDGGR